MTPIPAKLTSPHQCIPSNIHPMAKATKNRKNRWVGLTHHANPKSVTHNHKVNSVIMNDYRNKRLEFSILAQ